MAEKLAGKDAPSAPVLKTEGVVNLWRSTRTMQIWSQAQDERFVMRAIGDEVTVMLMTGSAWERELLRWSAPRAWWDEQTRVSRDGKVYCGMIYVPRETVRGLLAQLDAKQPALIAEASKKAAVTQAVMDQEKSEEGDWLSLAEPTLAQTPSQ